MMNSNLVEYTVFNSHEIDTSFSNYVGLLVFFGCSTLVVVVLFLVSVVGGSLSFVFNVEKMSTYECGFNPFGDSRMKFNVSFYIVALLFIIFDLEVVFLFPWAVQLFWGIDVFGFFVMVWFLVILTVGFVFEWINGALDL
jgi:NADH-quinone oxidoreductase subunit A